MRRRKGKLRRSTLCSTGTRACGLVKINTTASVFNQLDAQNLFHNKFYFMPLNVLIIRRSKLHYTASGIITPIGVMIPEAV